MDGGDHILQHLSAAVEAGRPVALATVVETHRSVPRHAGTKMVVYEDGSSLGTVGGGAMEAAVGAEAADALRNGRPRLLEYDLLNPAEGDPGVCGGTVKIYLEPFMPAHTVYVIGCGHVGKSVVELAHWLGYRTVAVDDREELVSEAALPHADIRFHGTIEDALDEHPIVPDSSVVVVTRSTDLDAAVLPTVLKTPARYVGVMGSRRRWQSTTERLLAAGVSADDIERVHSPIGIEVNAETLEEIAVSIMSEVISVNRSLES